MALTFALLGGTIYLVGVLLHVPGFNAVGYWQWDWRRADLVRVVATMGPGVAVYVGCVWAALRRESERQLSRRSVAGILGGLAVANLLIQFGAFLGSDSWAAFRRVIESVGSTSYYADALTILDIGAALDRWWELPLREHSQTKPPGPVLFYWVFIYHLESDAAPVLAGGLIGVLGALTVPLSYAFARLFTPDRRVAVVVAATWAVSSALCLFLPAFDQIYPAATMFLIIAWHRTLSRGSLRWATIFGATLAVSLFFAFNLLLLGATFALMAGWHLWRNRWDRSAVAQVAVASVVGLGVVAAFNGLLAATVGYDPIQVFRGALAAQDAHATGLDRSYLDALRRDPFDFLRGSGWVALPLAIGFVAQLHRRQAAAPLTRNFGITQ